MKYKNNIQETATYLQSLEPGLSLDLVVLDKSLETNQGNQTLAIKILSIFGGILSSTTFFGFLLIAGLHKSNIALLIFGILAIALGVIIGKLFRQILWDTVSVFTFSIGFIMLAMALSEFHVDTQYISISCAVFSLVCLCLTPNYIISFVSTLILNGSILNFVLSTNQYDFIYIHVSLLAIILTYTFLQEARLLHISFKIKLPYHAIRMGLVLSFLIGLGLLRQDIFFTLSTSLTLSVSIVCMMAILYLSSKLLTTLHPSVIITRLAIYGLILLVLAPTVLFPGIVGSILLILLCFWVNYKTGFVMGIIALLYFVGQFYYDLNYTLLTKSVLLFLSGVVFLLFYLFISKRTNHEKI